MSKVLEALGVLLIATLVLSGLILMLTITSPNGFPHGPLTGIHLQHDSKDVTRLYVSTNQPGNSNSLRPYGNTDGNGLWTFYAPYWGGAVYDFYFTFGGQGYDIPATIGQTIEITI